MKLFVLLLTVVTASGCANPGIVQVSPDTYLLIREDHAGVFGNSGSLKAGVIADASKFAAKQGKVAIPISSNFTPNGPLRFASFEYQFRLVDPNGPGARPTPLLPVAPDPQEKIATEMERQNNIAEQSQRNEAARQVQQIFDSPKRDGRKTTNCTSRPIYDRGGNLLRTDTECE